MTEPAWPEPSFPDYVPTVANAVADAAAARGDHPFVVTPEDSVTYAQLDGRSRHLAARLVQAGVTKGDKVAVLFPNSAAWVISWVAVTRIGAVIVPVSTFYKEFELGRFLRHSDVGYLLGVPTFLTHDYAQRIAAVAPELADQTGTELLLPSLPQLRAVFFWGDSPVPWATGGWGEGLDDEPPALPAAVAAAMEEDVTPADPMMLMYTSGSTADPKGALHSHGGMTRHATNLAALSEWESSFRLWSPMPFFWIGGFHTIMFRTLVSGATLVTQGAVDAGEVLETVEREKVTHILAWPGTNQSLMDHPRYASTDFSSVLGGSLYDQVPVDRRPPDLTLSCNSLGMTETCGPHSSYRLHEERHGVPPEYQGTFGRRVPGVEVRIVDFDTGEPLPDGMEGEVVVRGYSVMLGIYKQERADTFDADGWYHTSDRGLYRDGWLFFSGRQSDMIKTSGSNVAPAEVEMCLTTFPEVMQAFVLGVPHPTHGQDVVALVVPWSSESGDHGTLDTQDIRARLKQQLSSFKVPGRFFVLNEDEVPWLPSQKPDRRALAKLAQELVKANV
ncbi:MAG TPA: class I adenylate-forming enzyme family protein [Acidimicrobiales bacterium]|nr:class I adenylate-forming enzyme family protein [Acidimicrobiales bacterium]